jgi:hypothetical protein
MTANAVERMERNVGLRQMPEEHRDVERDVALGHLNDEVDRERGEDDEQERAVRSPEEELALCPPLLERETTSPSSAAASSTDSAAHRR